ncbi:MAG: YoaK family protein [Caulobacteraceae bacterium]|nr:YoaK family protein [Caulobacteraceae bacterium]
MRRSKLPLSLVLSFTGGYVDTAGFLAFQGLFTAHVTGNFVTLGASLVHGRGGGLAKLLALPTFCLVVLLVRLYAVRLTRRHAQVLTRVLALQLLFLTIGTAMAIILGPFSNGDSLPAVATGLILVTAMAIQNAAHRTHLSRAPPSTLMTGTTTQIMIDLADLIAGSTPDDVAATRRRLGRFSMAVAVFASGCGLAALAYATLNVRVFALLPVLGALALVADQEVKP